MITLIVKPHVIKIVFSLSLFFLTACGTSPMTPPKVVKPIALKYINIVDVESGEILANKHLLIRDGKIEQILESEQTIEPEYESIDMRGKFVIPGLVDAHVHLMDKSQLKLNLAKGVTTVRVMRGFDMHLDWKQELKNGEWLGSTMFVSSPVLANENTHELNQPISSVEQAREEVRRAKERGFDLIKAYGYLKPEHFEAIVDEARKLNFPVAKHGPSPVKGSSWEYVQGLQSMEHVEDVFQGPLDYQFDITLLPPYVEQLKASGTPVVATLATFAHLAKLSKEKQTFVDTIPMEYMNPFKHWLETKYTVSRWLAEPPENSDYHLMELDFLQLITKRLHDAGVMMVTGSDAGTMYLQNGFALHEEMALLSQAGISNADVLKMATLNASIMLKNDDKYGTVTEGKIADLLVSDLNPTIALSTLSTPYAVVKNGQLLNAEHLKQLTTEATDHSSFSATLFRLLKDMWIR